MASCNSCRIYFYLGSPTSQYNDFIELNSSGTTINADTSRVDAFGLPLAIHLHNSDGSDTVVGEDDQVFAESRTALFTQFENYVPAAFKQLATVDAPYSIPSPTDVAAFQPGGADASYMTAYAASLGDTETTQEVFGCQGGGTPALNGNASLCAGLNRCVAQFSTTVQNTPSDYYQNAPVQLLLRVLALGRRQRPCVRLRLRRRQRPVLRLQQHRRAVRAGSRSASSPGRPARMLHRP